MLITKSTTENNIYLAVKLVISLANQFLTRDTEALSICRPGTPDKEKDNETYIENDQEHIIRTLFLGFSNTERIKFYTRIREAGFGTFMHTSASYKLFTITRIKESEVLLFTKDLLNVGCTKEDCESFTQLFPSGMPLTIESLDKAYNEILGTDLDRFLRKRLSKADYTSYRLFSGTDKTEKENVILDYLRKALTTKTKPKVVTVDLLKEWHCCEEGIEKFKGVFPDLEYPSGVEINPLNLRIARELDLFWLAEQILDKEELDTLHGSLGSYDIDETPYQKKQRITLKYIKALTNEESEDKD
jgi:hypothetical protein